MKSNDDKKPGAAEVDDTKVDLGSNANVDIGANASADEREQASVLRDALDDGADPISGLLSAALRPGELDDEIHEKILAKALGLTVSTGGAALRDDSVAGAPEAHDVDLRSNAAETRAAAELRDALDVLDGRPRLETRAADHPLVGIAYALKHAHAPRPIDDIKNEALLRPALKLSSLASRRRVAFGAVLGTLAVAAAFLGLYATQPAMFGARTEAPAAALAPPPPDSFVPGMVEVHSTSELFQPEDFPRTGGATSRIDRISQARQADLRQNRFASWGLP